MRIIACEQCALRARSIVADLPVDRLRDFRACSVIAPYRRRQVIFHEGSPANGLYVVCRGAVKVYQSDRFGRDHILAVAEPGDVLGELPLDPGKPYSVSAEALTDTQLCYLPRERLFHFLRLHPVVSVRLIAALSKALGVARRKAVTLALKPAEGRLVELLLELAGGRGAGKRQPGVALSYSRRQIGEMIGVSTETAIRLLAQLKRKGAIDVQSRQISVTDLAMLRRLGTRHGVA